MTDGFTDFAAATAKSCNLTVDSWAAVTSASFTANIYTTTSGFTAGDDLMMRIQIFSLIDYTQVFYSDPIYVVPTVTVVSSTSLFINAQTFTVSQNMTTVAALYQTGAFRMKA